MKKKRLVLGGISVKAFAVFIICVSALLLSSSNAEATTVNSSGQIFYLTMNPSVSGVTQTNDSSGNGNNFVVQANQPLYDTAWYEFTNSSAKMNSSAVSGAMNSLATTRQVTLNMWVRINQTRQFNAFGDIFFLENSSGSDILNIYVHNASSYISGKIWNSSGTTTDVPIVPVGTFTGWNDGQFHMVTWVIDACGANRVYGYGDGWQVGGFNNLNQGNCTAIFDATNGQFRFGSAGYFDIREVRLFNRTLSELEVNQLYKYGLYMDNQSNVSLTGNSTQVKNISSTIGYAGYFELGNLSMLDPAGSGTLSIYNDYTNTRNNLSSGARANLFRRDMSLVSVQNVGTSIGTFTYKTNTNTSVGNINNHKSDVKWLYENDFTTILTVFGTPQWNSINNSACYYGTTVNTARYCEPNNYTLWGNAVVDYLDQVTANGTYTDNLMIEVWNEAYTIYWMNNGSCAVKSAAYIRLYNNTRSAIRAVPRYANLPFGGMDFYDDSSCSIQMTNEFYGNFTSNDYEWVPIHDYDGYDELPQEAVDAANNVTAITGQPTKPIIFTELNANDATLQSTPADWYLLDIGKLETMSKFSVINQNISVAWFQWTSEDPTGCCSPNTYWDYMSVLMTTPRVNYNITKNVNTYFPKGSNVRGWVSNNTQVFSLYGQNTNGSYYVFMANKDNISHNILFNGSGLSGQSSLVNRQTGESFAYNTATGFFAGVNVEPNNYGIFEVQTNATISFSATSPDQNVSIVEPNNQSFAFNLSNPNSLPYTTTWLLNGTNQTTCFNQTSCTFLGNYSAAGTWIINATVVASSNTISYQWNLTVNQTVQNISLSAVSPSASIVNISAGASQLFSYTLSNPDSLLVTSQWFNNGTNITGCYNQTSCTISTLPSTATSSLNITVSVVASTNTVSNEWTLNITNSGEDVLSNICTNGAGATGELADWLPIIALVIAAAVVIGSIGLYQSGNLPSIGVGDLGGIALVLVFTAVTITVGVSIIVSALC